MQSICKATQGMEQKDTAGEQQLADTNNLAARLWSVENHSLFFVELASIVLLFASIPVVGIGIPVCCGPFAPVAQ